MLSNEACLKYTAEEHYCPHCNQRLSCCQTPPFHVGDGLGWGTEVMFVCLNDECSLFVNSWKKFEEQYGHTASCRYMLLPNEKKGSAMMVGSKEAFTGCILDPEELKKTNDRYAREKTAICLLNTCVKEQNLEPAMTLILDEMAQLAERKRAIDLLLELNNLECIDPIKNHSFHNTELEQQSNMVIAALLKKNFKKECPFCAEIIKNKAKICKHCGKEV